jgi:hypothetical protein
MFILHNFITKHEGDYEQDSDCDSGTSNYIVAILWQRGTSTDTSFQIWDKFKEFFCSSEGHVEQ